MEGAGRFHDPEDSDQKLEKPLLVLDLAPARQYPNNSLINSIMISLHNGLKLDEISASLYIML